MLQGRNLRDSDLLAPFLILKVFPYRENKMNDFFIWVLTLSCRFFFFFFSFRWLTQAPRNLVLSLIDLSLCWPTHL